MRLVRQCLRPAGNCNIISTAASVCMLRAIIFRVKFRSVNLVKGTECVHEACRRASGLPPRSVQLVIMKLAYSKWTKRLSSPQGMSC